MGIIFAGGRTEDALAHYAEYQGQTTSCGEYSVAAGLSLLKGGPHWLPAQEVVGIADSWTWLDSIRTMGPLGVFGGRSLRMWKGGPTTSWQVANLALRLAQVHTFKVTAGVNRGDADTRSQMIALLARPDAVTIITIAWDELTEATIIDPNQIPLKLTSTPKLAIGNLTIDYTAHIMVLAAHDDDQKRWGFINSWADGANVSRLYWMSESDFDETWGYGRSPFFIPRLWVSITLQ